MLRIQPIYGSRYSLEGQAEEPTCTLVEYGDCRVLLNVGWWSAGSNLNDNNNNASRDDNTHEDATFPTLPDHDALILSDSTLQSLGGLPLYYRQMQERMKQRREQDALERQRLKEHNNVMMVEDDYEDPQWYELPPIYATFPTVKMGQMTLYDLHANLCLDGYRPPFSLQDLDDVMASITAIKYSQTILLRPRTRTMAAATAMAPLHMRHIALQQQSSQPTLSVTAHRAGHCVGGSFYVLQRLQDETTVVLTKHYHIAKELHLDSSTLLQHASTPDVLVTYPGGPSLFKALASPPPPSSNNNGAGRQKKRAPVLPPQLVTQLERTLTESVLSVLRREGNVLIPVDAASRVLELVACLQQHWDRHRLQAAYNLVWLGPMVSNTAELSQSQLEWMSAALQEQQQTLQLPSSSTGTGPASAAGGAGGGTTTVGSFLRSPSLQLCDSVTQVERLMQQNPTCILASGCSLEYGPARNILLLLADNPDNAVIFTDSSFAYLRRGGRDHQQPPAQQASNKASETTVTNDAMEISAESTTSIPNPGDSATSATEEGAAAEAQRASPSDGEVKISAPTPNVESNQQQKQQTSPNVVMDEENDEPPAPGDIGLSTTTATVGLQQTSEWTTAAQLLRAWGQAKAEGREMEDSVFVDIAVPRKQPLAGTELKEFLQAEEAARLLEQQQAERQAMLREVELAKGQLRLGEDDDATKKGPTTTSTSAGHSSGPSGGGTSSTTAMTRPRKKSRFDQTLFLKYSKPLHLTFEVREEAVGIGQNDSTAKYGIGESIGRSGEVLEDDYGIAVRPEHFTDIVSGVDPSKIGSTGRVGDDVRRRGFGYAGSTTAGPGGTGTSGRVSEDEGPDDINDELQEKELEALDLSEGKGIIRGRNGRPPMKMTTVYQKLEVLAEINYVPLEGRVDARSARQSVRALQPRQVVVLGGPCKGSIPQGQIDAVTELAEASKSFATAHADVLTPSDGEMAQLSVGHAAFAVRLIETPYQTEEEKQNSAEPPQPIEPHEVKLGACTVSVLDYVATGQKVAVDGSLVLAPRLAADREASSVYLSAGDVLLTDLRAELIAQGLKADYSAQKGYSQLVVSGKVYVRKEQGTERISVEGPLCEDFWAVRQVVCGQYVVL